MNDQEQPEDGINPSPVVAEAATTEDVTTEVHEPVVDDVMEDEEFDGDEFSDEEFEDDADLDEMDEEEAVRSLVEELFDEDDLGEVMSELDVLTLEDAAAYLKVEYGQIRRLIKEQGLPGRKIGDEWRFLRGAIADWLRAPAGNVAPAAKAAPERAERPAQSERREFTQKPPLRERFSQGNEGQQQRYPQQGGTRYPQQGSRYPQNEGGYQGGGQGGYQGQGNQGGYPPPRRPRYGNDQEQQGQQYEYRPPRRPYAGGQGNFGNQGGNFSGGRKFGGGPKKPKRRALNEQRFNRLDRRRGEDGGDQGSQDSND